MAQKVVVKNPYGGVKFRELCRLKGNTDGTFCFAGKRYVIHGIGVVDFIFDSYKWPNQLAFNTWTRKLPEIETRAFSDEYTRSAIAYDKKQFTEILGTLLAFELDVGTAFSLANRVAKRIWELR